MDINELVKLQTNKKNINKINTFLKNVKKNSDDYIKAQTLKANMLYDLNYIDKSLNLLQECFSNAISNKEIIIYCDSLILTYLNIKDFSNAMKYINIKEDYLDPIDKQYHLKDLILYYIKKDDLNNCLINVDLYFSDDVDDVDKTYIHQLLFDYYFEHNDFTNCLKEYNELIDFYKENGLLEKLEKINFAKFNILYDSKKYEEALNFLNDIDISFFQIKNKIILFKKEIEIYMINNNYRYASILDSNFEMFVKDNAIKFINESIEYYQLTLNLYKKLNNSFSLNYIKSQITRLSLELKKSQTIKKSVKKETRIVEKVIEKEIYKEVKTDNTNIIESDESEINVTSKYNIFSEIIDDLNKLDARTLFREVLRNILYKFCDKFNFEEAFLLVKGSNFYGYHYKMGRLYDKHFDLKFDFGKSILNRCIELSKEVVINDLSKVFYNISIINNEKIKYKQCVVFPIYYDSICIGSIGYFSNYDMQFEFFKFISSIINIYFKNEYKINILNSIDSSLKKLENDLPIGIKNVNLNKITLNQVSQKILKLNTNSLSLNEYYEIVNNNDKSNYKQVIQNLLYEEIKFSEIQYQLIDGKFIKETFFKQENNTILSYIEDISKYVLKNNELLDFAMSDNYTKVKSYKAFKTDATSIFKEHNKSLVSIDGTNYSLYEKLYGFDFVNQLVYAMGNFLISNEKKYNYLAYHIESSKYILILNDNDIRRIKNKLKNILNGLSIYLYSINKRVNMKFYAGVFKQKSTDKNMTLNDMLSYSKEALIDAMSESKEISVYDKSIYYRPFFKDYSDELEISEALDKSRLEVVYIPIYDLNNNLILGYEYSLVLDNILVDKDRFNSLIRKRSLEFKLQKYIFKSMAYDMSVFNKKINKEINIFIPLFSKSLDDDRIFEYIKSIEEYYKIDLSHVFVKVIGDIESVEKIDKLKKFNINIGVNIIDNLFKYNLDTIYIEYKSYDLDTLILYKNILKEKIMILSGIESNIDLVNAKKITNFITGNAISKKVSMLNIINLEKNK